MSVNNAVLVLVGFLRKHYGRPVRSGELYLYFMKGVVSEAIPIELILPLEAFRSNGPSNFGSCFDRLESAGLLDNDQNAYFPTEDGEQKIAELEKQFGLRNFGMMTAYLAP